MTDALKQRLDAAWATLPLVAILRGVQPHEAAAIAQALYEQGLRLIEVPLNSPQALESIARLARSLPGDALVGAGTVLSVQAVDQVQAAGGQLIVMPHAELAVVRHAKSLGLACIPGAATPTEVLACAGAGADAVKLFPAELLTPAVVKALRAVLPASLRLLPVGGIRPDNLAAYRSAGVGGFGLGSALYQPGLGAAEVGLRARAFADAWRALAN